MWAGGKTKMLKHYAGLLPTEFGSYVEPFFGGGAMFIWAYKKNPNATFIINDVNPSIMNIYSAIKNDVDRFLDKLDSLDTRFIPLSKEDRGKFYFDLRHEHAYDYEKWDKTEEAAVLYFLMKTGFNGIWQINKNTNGRFGTPKGLLNQKGSVYDRENILEWNLALQKAIVLTGDYEQTKSMITSDSFVFMDPPYRDSFTQYNVDFNDTEQLRLLDFMEELSNNGSNVWLCNRDGEDAFWDRNKRNFNIHKFPVTYTAGRRKKTSEGFQAKKAVEILLTTF
jgi:DNA adenine methylase